MLLIWIVLSAVAGGLFALAVAHWLAYRVFSGYLHHMVSLSVGVLLAVSLLHLLPEAAETGLAPHALSACMLASIIGFFKSMARPTVCAILRAAAITCSSSSNFTALL